VTNLTLTILLLIPLVTSQSSVNITTDRPQYAVGSTVLISGNVLDGQGSPVDGASVSIQVNDPQNTPIHVNLVYTDQTGGYSDRFSLSLATSQGGYTIFASASKIGLNGTGSAQTQFIVISQTTSTILSSTTSSQLQPNASKCLIATATYGSEMTPEVVMLRDFRDSQVSHTATGRNFMLIFNTFYYSFSPQIATYISSHSNTRPFMKLLLYPTITILSITRALDTILESNSEIAIVASGIFASFTIGFVYVGIPLGILRLVRETKKRGAMIQWSALWCILSLSILAIGEIADSSVLLMISTATVVLSFLVLGGVSFPYLVKRMKD
jgi:hypothetical protein